MTGWPLMMMMMLVVLVVPAGCYETRYQKFLREHLDYPLETLVDRRYCATKLEERRVNGPGWPCKPVNTFVHAPDTELLALCASRRGPTMRTTATALHVTVCRATGGSVYYPCAYRTASLRQRVEVACENGRPVHLSRTL